MPPKPKAVSAKPVPGEGAAQALDAKFPVWNDAAIAAEAWDQPFLDGDTPILPTHLKDSITSWKKVSDVFHDAPCVIYAPSVVEPVAEAPAAGKGKAAPPPKGKPAPAAAVSAPRVPFEGFDRATLMNPLFQGIISVFDFINANREHLPTGNLLWELVAPRSPATGMSVVSAGKYAVKLYMNGAWRVVCVDDRVPVDSAGAALLPTTLHSELWPLLLSKALLKAAGGASADAVFAAHPVAVSLLTGWLPSQTPVTDLYAAVEAASAAHKPAAFVDPAVVTEELSEQRGAAGLPLGSLYVPQRAASVLWETRSHYSTVMNEARLVRIGSRAAKCVLVPCISLVPSFLPFFALSVISVPFRISFGHIFSDSPIVAVRRAGLATVTCQHGHESSKKL